MFEFYQRIGADLVPLQRYVQGDKDSKRPLMRSWTNTIYDIRTVLDLFETGHSVGYRPKPTELIIDVEAATSGGHTVDGRESFTRLCDDFAIDLSRVPAVSSPSGGRHYYFTKHENAPVRKHLDDYPGIDFLSSGTQVVAAGSRHWQGGEYTLNAETDLYGFTPPEAAIELISCLAPAPRIPGSPEGGILSAEELRSMLSFLDARKFDSNEAWLQILMSSHHATGGAAYEVFEEWSWSDPKWTDCPDVEPRWTSLGERDNPVTFRTLFFEVRKACVASGNMVGLNLVTLLQDTRCLEVPPQTDEDGNQIAPVDPLHITCDHNETARIDQGVEGISRCPNLYKRGGNLVRISKEESPPAWQEHTEDSWAISDASQKAVRGLLGQYCAFFNLKPTKLEDGSTEWVRERTRCPVWLLEGFCSRPSWPGIHPLDAIIQAPCMLKDGSVLQEPGFNATHGLMYKPNQTFLPVAEAPTLQDAQNAVRELHEVVADFPFVTDNHRSVWLAALLTLFARHSYRAPTPMFFFDGNKSGVGKSLLIDAIGYITLGRCVAKMTYPPNDEEMDKRLTPIIRNSTPIQLLDNVPNDKEFGFPSLDAAITSGTWNARILGKSDTTGDMAVTTLFCATGNNLKLGTSADAARRLAYCRIVYKGEDPSTRTGFKHADLPQWLLDNRARLVKACLTILKAYHVAGSPPVAMPTWGSFERWSAAVRAPLVWLGEPDPMGSRVEMNAQADVARDKFSMVIEGWREVAGLEWMTVAQMLERYGESRTEFPCMSDCLDLVIDERKSRYPAAIGKTLGTYLNHNTDGWEMQVGSGRRRGHYRVVQETTSATDWMTLPPTTDWMS